MTEDEENLLHRQESHPDWEYTTTTNQRKSDTAPLPEGDGWIPNNIVPNHHYVEGELIREYWRPWARHEYHETNYWRRRRLTRLLSEGSHDMAAADGPTCRCGKPSRHESGWCGECVAKEVPRGGIDTPS
jgi:hypothetical protein